MANSSSSCAHAYTRVATAADSGCSIDNAKVITSIAIDIDHDAYVAIARLGHL